jgi:hypothetical protein
MQNNIMEIIFPAILYAGIAAQIYWLTINNTIAHATEIKNSLPPAVCFSSISVTNPFIKIIISYYNIIIYMSLIVNGFIFQHFLITKITGVCRFT